MKTLSEKEIKRITEAAWKIIKDENLDERDFHILLKYITTCMEKTGFTY